MANRIGAHISPSITPYFDDKTAHPPAPPATPSQSNASVRLTASCRVDKINKSDAGKLEGFLRSLRETQGGVAARFPSTSKRELIRRHLADSCSGVARQVAARAIGLFGQTVTYRGEARRFRGQINETRRSYPRLSRRLSSRAFARALARSPWHGAHSRVIDRLDATQSMRTPKRIARYNREVLPEQLSRLGRADAPRPAEFHVEHDSSRHRDRLRRVLATGAPVVLGISAYYHATGEPGPRWHNNCHYVVAVKLPGKQKVLIIDSWPGAKHGGVTKQDLRRLRMPGTYGAYRDPRGRRGPHPRLGTIFGVFRHARTKEPFAARVPCATPRQP